MFGDKLIIGKSTRQMDKKGRIFIPKFSDAEPGDEIIVEPIKTDNGYDIRLMAYKEYFNICQRFMKLRDNATSTEEFNRYSSEIEKLCSLLEATLTVDGQRRIAFPKETLDNLSLETDTEYNFIGQGVSLLMSKK